MVSKATCAASSCETLSPCRGLRPHHARKDRVGTWETSSGPQSLWRSRAAAGRRGAEAAVEQARSSDEPRSTGEAPEQGRDERRRRAWREGGSVGGMVGDWRCSGRRTGPRIVSPSPACGSALRSNLRARPIAPDLRQEPGAGKPHAGICAGGREKSLALPRQPRKSCYPGRRRFNPDGRRHGGTRQRECSDSSARSETLACAEALCPGTGRSLAHPGRLRRRIASGR